MCENLKAEKALLKESEVRLMQENKSLLEHQKSQNALVTNLQTLQVSYLTKIPKFHLEMESVGQVRYLPLTF